MRNWTFLFLLGITACETRKPEPTRQATDHLAPSRHEFSCDTLSVTADTLIGDVAGAAGQALIVRPTFDPCRYDLIHVDQDGVEAKLNNRPGMTFLARGLATPTLADATRVAVCWTDLSHRREGRGGAGTATGSSLVRRAIVAVDVVCRVRDGKRWRPAVRLTNGGNEWAAWLDGVMPDESEPGAFRVTWTRDSTFTFLGGNKKRQATDGLYASTVLPRGRKPPAPGDPLRLGPIELEVTAKVE